MLPIPQCFGHLLVSLPRIGHRPVRLDSLRDCPPQFGIMATCKLRG